MKKTEGTVTMSLDAYNVLHDKLVRYENAFRLKNMRSEYSDRIYYDIEVKVDLTVFREMLEDKLEDVPENVLEGFVDKEIDWDNLTDARINLISNSVKKTKEEE